MTKFKLMIAAGIVAVVGSSAGASTPQAWAALDREPIAPALLLQG